MRYYTEGYEDVYKEDELEYEFKDKYENYVATNERNGVYSVPFMVYIDEVLGLHCIDLDHKDGDFYVKCMDEEDVIYTCCSLASALEGWACNCDHIYQVRNGKVIKYFSTQYGEYDEDETYEELLDSLYAEGYDHEEVEE